MIVQKWRVEIESSTYEVEYRYSKLSGKTVLAVDGDEFAVKGKPFGIGAQRSEQVIVGMTQGILSVKKDGRATLIVREADRVTEI